MWDPHSPVRCAGVGPCPDVMAQVSNGNCRRRDVAFLCFLVMLSVVCILSSLCRQTPERATPYSLRTSQGTCCPPHAWHLLSPLLSPLEVLPPVQFALVCVPTPPPDSGGSPSPAPLGASAPQCLVLAALPRPTYSRCWIGQPALSLTPWTHPWVAAVLPWVASSLTMRTGWVRPGKISTNKFFGC